MTRITKAVLENNLDTVFTFDDLKKLYPNDNVRYCQLKRAIKNNEITRLAKGYFTLGELFRKKPVDIEAFSQMLDCNSYVSMTSALRNHNWIPESVFLCTNVTTGKNRYIETPYFGIDFRNLKQVDYSKGVRKVNYYGNDFLQATPLKAIADYVSWMKCDWTGIEPLIESLRIEEEQLMELKTSDFNELQGNYPCYPNTENFIDTLRKELKL